MATVAAGNRVQARSRGLRPGPGYRVVVVTATLSRATAITLEPIPSAG